MIKRILFIIRIKLVFNIKITIVNSLREHSIVNLSKVFFFVSNFDCGIFLFFALKIKLETKDIVSKFRENIYLVKS